MSVSIINRADTAVPTKYSLALFDSIVSPVFHFFTGDVQIVVQIVLDKGANVSAYKSPSQETIKVILSQFSVVLIFWQNRMITLTYAIKIFIKPVAKCVVCQR